MENMSILNLFSAAQGLTPSKSADAGQGEFEGIFKSYLDRSADTAPLQNKAQQAKTEKPEKINEEEPSTPQEVIDNLDIPAKDKKELQKMLKEADTPEKISQFLDKLAEKIKKSFAAEGNEVNIKPAEVLKKVEEVLTQIAQSVLAASGKTTPKQNQLLEQTLDRIVDVQAKIASNKPQLTVVKPETVNQNSSAGHEQGDTKSGKEAMLDAAKNRNGQQLTADMKERIVQLAENRTTEPAANQNTKIEIRSGEEFLVKTAEVADKVIKTEMRIEGPRDIMRFAEIMELAKSQKATRINIQLHPQELGKIQVQLTEQAGKITGKIFFESDSARQLFANNTESLRQQLAEKGVIMESLELATKDFEQRQFAGWEGRESKKNGKGGGENLINRNDTDDNEDNKESEGIYA